MVRPVRNPDQKQPDEKHSGEFNPGNMAGKTAGTSKDRPDKSDADGTGGRKHQTDNFNPGNMAGKAAGTSSKPD